MTGLTNLGGNFTRQRPQGGRTFWRKVWVNRLGIVGVTVMLCFVVAAVFGSWIAPKDPVEIDLGNAYAQPVWLDPAEGVGILGKDNLGRDILSRILVGSRNSLLIAFSAVIIGMTLGVFLGLIAGYRGGLIDDIIMRIADTQTAIPFLVLLIAVIAFLGGGLLNMIAFLGLGSWVGFARLIRGEELSIRERDYIHSARALGVSDLRIMFRHILPNAIQPVIVAASLSFGGVILTEAALSFLGLGVGSIVPTWARWWPTHVTT